MVLVLTTRASVTGPGGALGSGLSSPHRTVARLR